MNADRDRILTIKMRKNINNSKELKKNKIKKNEHRKNI